MIADLHSHAAPASRDSRMSLEQWARAANAVGLEAIALTDHGPGSDYAAARASLGEVMLVPGREISTSFGHVIALCPDEAWLAGLPERCELPLPGGRRGPLALVWAHPAGWRVAGALVAPPDPGAGLEHLHGVEVLNGERLYQASGVAMAARLATEHGLSACGGSDSHDPAMVGRCLTAVDDASTVPELIEGIAAHRARPLLGAAWAAANDQRYEREDLLAYL